MPRIYSRSYKKYTPKRKGYKKAYAPRYAKSFRARDRFSTLSNSPSPYPAPLRAVQGGYSRAAFARAAVRADLEVKNLDTTPTTQNLMWGTLANPLPAVAPNPLAPDYYITQLGTIAGIAQGSASFNREGRKVVIKGVEQRHTFTLQPAAAAANSTATVRLLTVLDNQANGLSPLTESVLFQLANYPTNSLYNLDNAARFKIITDDTFELNSNAVVGANTVSTTKSKVIKAVLNVPMEFSSTEGTLDNIRSANLFNILIIGGSTDVRVQAVYSTRVLFVG